MRNDEWRLVYSGTDYTFGTGASEVFNLTAPDLGDVTLQTADTERPREDGLSFGVDFAGGRTVAFDLGVQGASEADVRAAMARLARAWRGDSVRSKAGAVAELRSRYRDEERLVYGRPRRFAPNLSGAKSGLGTATADFASVDGNFYAVTERSASVALVPSGSGGLLAPLASPLLTTESSDRSVGLTVDGDVPTWPVIEIPGPITNPVIELVGRWRIETRVSLAFDQKLTIDARPWARTFLVNGGSVAGQVTRESTRLVNATLPPGSWELALRGSSVTGSPVARVRWRDAFSTN